CLDDLARTAALPSAEDRRFWERTELLVIVPAQLADRFGEGADDLQDLRVAYLERLLGLWGRPIGAGSAALVAGGHAGAIVALERAWEIVTAHVADRVILIGADSYLDNLSLTYLAEAHRLKTNENPAGLSPGQAAAAVLLEPVSVSKRRGACMEALVL